MADDYVRRPLLSDAAILDIGRTIDVWKASGVSPSTAWKALEQRGPVDGWPHVWAHMLQSSFLRGVRLDDDVLLVEAVERSSA